MNLPVKACILPAGNRSEFPSLRRELSIRRVVFAEVRLSGGGVVFLIPVDQLEKLPKDERGPYLGDEDSGHSIYDMSTEQLDGLMY